MLIYLLKVINLHMYCDIIAIAVGIILSICDQIDENLPPTHNRHIK